MGFIYSHIKMGVCTWINHFLFCCQKNQLFFHTFQNYNIVCFVAFRPKSTAYVVAGRSVNLTTLFSWVCLNKRLTSTSCTYFCLKLTTTLLKCFSWREENGRRNCFMINLQESMGPGQVRTRNRWICNQTRICSQTRYWLPYVAR